MQNPNDFTNDGAKNYLDFWQEQWSKAAASPEWQRMMAENMLKMQELFKQSPTSANGFGHEFNSPFASGSTSARASSDDRFAMLDELVLRIDQLEQRINKLEQK